MKNLLLILSLLITTSIFAQEKWGEVNKNSVVMYEFGPIWPGCEGGTIETRRACFEKNLVQHIVKNYKYPANEYKKNIQGKVVVKFVINQKGIVAIKSVTGGNKGLQAEAKRNILEIPKMTPGMMGGKPIESEFTVPFTFKTNK